MINRGFFQEDSQTPFLFLLRFNPIIQYVCPLIHALVSPIMVVQLLLQPVAFSFMHSGVRDVQVEEARLLPEPQCYLQMRQEGHPAISFGLAL